MASPRETDHRGGTALSPRPTTPGLITRPEGHPTPQRPQFRRHHFHDHPPWPHQRYHDYIFVDRWGWWPRWYPYWDQGWYAYWWSLYDYYGGDSYPEYAEYASDAFLRQNAPQWGLVVSGAWMGADPQGGAIIRDHRGSGPIVRDHRGLVPPHGGPTPPGSGIVPPHGGPTPPGSSAPPNGYDDQRRRYRHPHDYYGDYVVVESAWWPRWFPYWDPGWIRYWWQLYYYFGGDTYADYAQYARDAYLRALARQWGWI